MDTGALKTFAKEARRTLRDQVTARLALVRDEAHPARREDPAAFAQLEAEIAKSSAEQVIEKVAYTWFNRFCALRFMDANGHGSVRAVSPADAQTRPELLAEAMSGAISAAIAPDIAARVSALLEGRTPSRDPQGEAYRLLLVAICNHWHAAMPFLFETIADYTELLMPEDLLSPDGILARMRCVMTEEVCTDVEIIGWLYQFYISEKKDEVFAGLKKNRKITPENIPAATQLFTPHWIVRYLVENSLGRLWLLNRPHSGLAAQMDYYVAPETPESDFLRIDRPEDIRICDPACGSGHMLTYAFDLLHAIYEEEGYDAAEIPGLILTHNLYGIEIDERAGALAAFALVMKATARRRRFLRHPVQPNICVLETVAFRPDELEQYAAAVGPDLFTAALRQTLGQFTEAKNFGSLIRSALTDLAVVDAIAALDFSGNLYLRDVHARVMAVLRMVIALSPRYHVVVANPPYMGGKGMNVRLSDWAKKNYPSGKTDLYSMFMERCLELAEQNCYMAMINMQSWMFLSSFDDLRRKLLGHATLMTMAHIGERGFDTIGGAVVSTTSFVFKKSRDPARNGAYLRLIDGRSEREKSEMARDAIKQRSKNFYTASSADFERVPRMPIAYWLSARTLEIFEKTAPLKDIASPRQGMATTNNDLFLRQWFEVARDRTGLGLSPEHARISHLKWFPLNKGGEFRRWFGNNEYVVNFENAGRDICDYIDNTPDVRVRSNGRVINRESYFREGLTWSTISTGKFALRYSPQGSIFETKGAMIFFDADASTFSVLGLLNTPLPDHFLKATSPTLDFHEGPVGRLPLKFDHTTVNETTKSISERAVGISKRDWDAYETSWNFAELPLIAHKHRQATLAETYAHVRMHWQGITDEMRALEEQNNRIFIDAYDLADELAPEVPLAEITLTCNPAYRYGANKSADELEALLLADTMRELVSYAVGCMFGRYSLDAPGLMIASQGEGLDAYAARVPETSFAPDTDNVIPVLEGEWFADDVAQRFRHFLRTAFGDEQFVNNLQFVEDALGKDIRKYFTRDFYADHVRRYRKRPIYWMFSSPKGSFNALIYLHRYRADTVSVVLNDYLREFRAKLETHRTAQAALSINPDETPARKAKALKEIDLATRQIAELDDWERDILFPLASQRLEIDLDDGVKANYPKFGAALKPIKGLEEAEA